MGHWRKLMVSVIIASVRDYRWKDIVEEYDCTKTDYEIIVCGPCPPRDLGPRFTSIQTPVKGAQCIEIAVRQSKGEYLYFTLDDVTHTPNILDTFLDYMLSCKEELVILSPGFTQLGNHFPPEAMTINGIGTPTMPVGMFMSKKDWETIGGVDRNFVRCYWDHDISMRCWAMGGKVVIHPNVFMDEIIPTLHTVWVSNASSSFHQDRPYLLSLWSQSPALINGKLNVTRTKPFEPFSVIGIMECDQGVPDAKKGISQNFDTEFYEHVRQTERKT
jgi:hypothetical protein